MIRKKGTNKVLWINGGKHWNIYKQLFLIKNNNWWSGRKAKNKILNTPWLDCLIIAQIEVPSGSRYAPTEDEHPRGASCVQNYIVGDIEKRLNLNTQSLDMNARISGHECTKDCYQTCPSETVWTSLFLFGTSEWRERWCISCALTLDILINQWWVAHDFSMLIKKYCFYPRRYKKCSK